MQILRERLEPAEDVTGDATLDTRPPERGDVTLDKKPPLQAQRGCMTPLLAVFTLNPKAYKLRPTTCTLHPAPYALRLAPYTLHPAPYTLRPTHCTLNPGLDLI